MMKLLHIWPERVPQHHFEQRFFIRAKTCVLNKRKEHQRLKTKVFWYVHLVDVVGRGGGGRKCIWAPSLCPASNPHWDPSLPYSPSRTSGQSPIRKVPISREKASRGCINSTIPVAAVVLWRSNIMSALGVGDLHRRKAEGGHISHCSSTLFLYFIFSFAQPLNFDFLIKGLRYVAYYYYLKGFRPCDKCAEFKSSSP